MPQTRLPAPVIAAAVLPKRRPARGNQNAARESGDPSHGAITGVRRYVLCWMLLILLFALTARLSGWLGAARDEAPLDASAADALARAKPICDMVAPPAADWRMTADPQQGYLGTSERQRLWNIEALNDAGEREVRLSFDAATGELLHLSQRISRTGVTPDNPCGDTGPPGDPDGKAISTPEQAGKVALGWLRRLGPPALTSAWRQDGPPIPTGTSWSFLFRAGDRSLRIILDACTGRLVVLRQYRRRGGPPPPQVVSIGRTRRPFPLTGAGWRPRTP